MADPQLKRPHQNWIIIDYPKMTAAPAAAEIVKTEAPEPAVSEAAVAAPVETPDATKTAAPEKTVEQRLSELKSIFDKGLISAEDYEAKKRTLLDEL
jgi:predicted flap endonuclease-1-like 5' DNA nuclease